MQGDGVVDAIAEKSDRRAQCTLGLDDPRLLLRSDAREDRRLWQRGRELRVVELIELGAGERSVDGQADVAADLLRDAVVIACDDLHLHVEALETVERLVGVGLRAIDEGEEACEVQVALVLGAQGRAALGGGARRDRNHAAAGGELAVEHGLRSWNNARAAGEHRLGRALDDNLPPAVLLDEDRCQAPLVVERKGGQAPSAVDAGGASAWRLPERLVELVAADHMPVGEGRVVAEQPGAQDRIRWPAVGVQSGGERDAALGQRAGLVGEQNDDVAEVLDAHQSLDHHLALS